MKNKLPLIVILAALIAFVCLFCRVTIIPDKVPQTEVNESGEEVVVADLSVAEQYCADNWESKMLPTIRERSHPVEEVIAAMKDDFNTAGEELGTRQNETSAWNFCVSGTAKVVGIDFPEKATKTRLLLDTAPYDGEADCKLQVSSVIKTNAVRDSVEFLRLDDFKDQVEFAELTKAFNAEIQKTVLNGIVPTDYDGKEVTFLGSVALTKFEEAEDMLIIPVEISAPGE